MQPGNKATIRYLCTLLLGSLAIAESCDSWWGLNRPSVISYGHLILHNVVTKGLSTLAFWNWIDADCTISTLLELFTWYHLLFLATSLKQCLHQPRGLIHVWIDAHWSASALTSCSLVQILIPPTVPGSLQWSIRRLVFLLAQLFSICS